MISLASKINKKIVKSYLHKLANSANTIKIQQQQVQAINEQQTKSKIDLNYLKQIRQFDNKSFNKEYLKLNLYQQNKFFLKILSNSYRYQFSTIYSHKKQLKTSFPQLISINNKYNKEKNRYNFNQIKTMLQQLIKAIQINPSLFNKNQKQINNFLQIIIKKFINMNKQELYTILLILNKRQKYFRIKKQILFDIQDAVEYKFSQLLALDSQKALNHIQTIYILRQIYEIKKTINNKDPILDQIVDMKFTSQQFQQLFSMLNTNGILTNANTRLQIEKFIHLLKKTNQLPMNSVQILRAIIDYNVDYFYNGSWIIDYCQNVYYTLMKQIQSKNLQERNNIFENMFTFIYCISKISKYHCLKEYSSNEQFTNSAINIIFSKILIFPVNINDSKQIKILGDFLSILNLFQTNHLPLKQFTKRVLNLFSEQKVSEQNYTPQLEENISNISFRLSTLIRNNEQILKDEQIMKKAWIWYISLLQNFLNKKKDLITFLRITQFIATIHQNVKDIDKSSILTKIKNLDQSASQYRSFEIVRLWAVFNKLNISSKIIQKMYLHIKNNQPSVAIENLTRTFLFTHNFKQIEDICYKVLKSSQPNPLFWKIILFRSKYSINRLWSQRLKELAKDYEVLHQMVNFLQAEQYNIHIGQIEALTHFILQSDLPNKQINQQIQKLFKFGKLNQALMYLRSKKINPIIIFSLFKKFMQSGQITHTHYFQTKVSFFNYLFYLLKNLQFDKELAYKLIQHSFTIQLRFSKQNVSGVQSIFRHVFHQTLRKGQQMYFKNPIFYETFEQTFQIMFKQNMNIYDTIQLIKGYQSIKMNKLLKQQKGQIQILNNPNFSKLQSLKQKIKQKNLKLYLLSYQKFKSQNNIDSYQNLEILNILLRYIQTPNLQICWKRITPQFLNQLQFQTIIILLRRLYKSASQFKNQQSLKMLEQITENLFNKIQQLLELEITKNLHKQNAFQFYKEYLDIYLLYMKRPLEKSSISIEMFFNERIKQNPNQFLSMLNNLFSLNIKLQKQTLKAVLQNLYQNKTLNFYDRFFPKLGQKRLADFFSYLIISGDEQLIKYFLDKLLIPLFEQEMIKTQLKALNSGRQSFRMVTENIGLQLITIKLKYPNLKASINRIQSNLDSQIISQNQLEYFQDFRINQEYLNKNDQGLSFEKITSQGLLHPINILKQKSEKNKSKHVFLIDSYHLLQGKTLIGHDALLIQFLQSVLKQKIQIRKIKL